MPASIKYAILSPSWLYCEWGYNTPRRESHSSIFSPAAKTDAGLSSREMHRSNDRLNSKHKSSCKRFPFNNFTCCFTLFPKCFSSFDHSTCALSVSGLYLALDGIYHPFWAAFPNNSTRRRTFTWRQIHPERGSHPPWRFFPENFGQSSTEHSSSNYNSDQYWPDFKFELLPLHSPLLRQSQLVSFPPLIDMLKFSGYPYLIRGHIVSIFSILAPPTHVYSYCATSSTQLVRPNF